MVLEAALDGSFDVPSAAAAAATEAAERLRQEGNAAFQRKAFEHALALYSQALALDGADRHLLFSNRSAALHALKQFARALDDAEQAIALAPTWSKGHLRKANACEGLRRWKDALDAYTAAAALEPSTDAAQAAKLARKIENLQERARGGGKAVQRGFLASGKVSALYSEKEDVVTEVVDASGETRAEEPHERNWRVMLRRLKQGCNANAAGVNARGERVVLDDGVFAKLLQESEFQKLVYPGIPAQQLTHAPRNLQTLLEDPWYEHELLALMPRVEAKAESVLENVKRRGAAQGEVMDAATESSLRPQVLQEAFGREVLAMVHRVNYKKHVMLANDARTLADPTADAASWDQLSSAFLDALLLGDTSTTDAGVAGVAVMDGYMGEEWADVLLADAQRMVKNNLLMETNVRTAIDVQSLQRGAAAAATTPSAPATRAATSGRMRFLELSECQREYPAVAELIEKLHALPFEMNKKRPTSAQLCAQFAHCTSLTHLRAGEAQPLRLDCGAGEKDNGFKLTCVYFINSLTPVNQQASGDATPVPGSLTLRTSLYVDAPVRSVAPVADRLVLFKSQHVYNEIMVLAAQQELFFVTFWIHGRELR